ncbi:MAG TPA: hypothetical protein VMF50_17360 [Candidatus Binataceae bacterium]|nr:hypothetical protein [Candidatus Binataceae bacterium]
MDGRDSLRRENAQHIADGNGKIANIERELLTLKADLPRQYVMRDDWIRFSNILEAKMDAMRAEMRQEITQLATRIGSE